MVENWIGMPTCVAVLRTRRTRHWADAEVDAVPLIVERVMFAAEVGVIETENIAGERDTKFEFVLLAVADEKAERNCTVIPGSGCGPILILSGLTFQVPGVASPDEYSVLPMTTYGFVVKPDVVYIT